jgi:hypothetical protein
MRRTYQHPEIEMPLPRNPLWWAAIAALIGAALGLYPLPVGFASIVVTLIRTFAFALFLVLYFRKSRFAWHTILITVALVIPLGVLTSTTVRIDRFFRPNLLWLYAFLYIVSIVLVWRSRKPYFVFVKATDAWRLGIT